MEVAEWQKLGEGGEGGGDGEWGRERGRMAEWCLWGQVVGDEVTKRSNQTNRSLVCLGFILKPTRNIRCF